MNRLPKLATALIGIATLALSTTACVIRLGEEPEQDNRLNFSYREGNEDSDNYLLEVRINGPILNTPSSSGILGFGSGVTYAYQVQDLIEEASEDDRVQGLFLRLSTPGGTVVGANVIFNALEAYQETTGNPIIAYIEGLAASGGVWSMVAADEIYAAPGSIVGSIGVVGPNWLYFDEPFAFDGGLLGGGVTTRNGIRQILISAGEGKDIGNPFREPTEEELQVLQRNVNNEYDKFVQHIADTRDLSPQQVREEIGAYIYGNQQAEQFNLIDGTSGRPEAITLLAEQAELGDDYQLVTVSEDDAGLFDLLFGEASATPLSREQQQAVIRQDLCEVSLNSLLAYYGNPISLCPAVYSSPEAQ